MARACPVCGGRRSKKAGVDPGGMGIARFRICAECGHRYLVPLPRWIGLVTYLAAAFVLGLMLVDWLAHPEGLEMTFTWKGRLGVAAFAGMLFWMGTQVLRGRTGYE
jgi:hypothetical protein